MNLTNGVCWFTSPLSSALISTLWCLHVHSSAVLQPPALKCTHLHSLMHPPALIYCSLTSCSEMHTHMVSGASMCTPLFSDLLLPLSLKCTCLHSLVHTLPSFLMLRPLPQLNCVAILFPTFSLAPMSTPHLCRLLPLQPLG
jgi:hypothetical protein